MDWASWHEAYDRADSGLARRLLVVQERIRAVLDDSPAGPLRVVSLCAGQGRDLLEVLADHPRRDDVHARLVELDPRNTAVAKEAVRAAGLHQVEVVTGDAALIAQYAGLVPAELVLACGVFGNISDEHVETTIDSCTELCQAGGAVVWTRHRKEPDLVPRICTWFAEREFELVWLSDPAEGFGVGVHRLTGTPRPLTTGRHLFTFAGSRSPAGPSGHQDVEL